MLREENDVLSNLAEGARTKDSALTLDDDSYPLVCTFDHFLELLENTVRYGYGAIRHPSFNSVSADRTLYELELWIARVSMNQRTIGTIKVKQSNLQQSVQGSILLTFRLSN